MNIEDFKNQVFETFSIAKISPEVSSAKWQEYANKVSANRPKNINEAKSLFIKCFSGYLITYYCFESIDNSDLNTLLMLAISLSKNDK